ncbi:MAG: hypothetical protein VYE74_08500, partial [Verrucomicrobiota bacterium]|nr:hypothetical protein [Verrucomicrobiota bacterium]
MATGTIQAVGKTSGKITKETIKVGDQFVISIGKTTAKTSGKLVTETIQTTAGVATATGKATSKAFLALAKTGQVTFVEGAKGFITSIPFVSDMDLSTPLLKPSWTLATRPLISFDPTKSSAWIGPVSHPK